MRRTLLAALLGLGIAASPTFAQQAEAADLAAIEARLAGRLGALVAERGFPGANLGLVLPDGRSLGVAAGFADPARDEAMTPASRMLSGSIGKTYFAAWILRRVEQGKVDLDAPISTWLGEREWFARLPNGPALTLRLLMRHQSGLPEHVQAPGFLQAVVAEPDKVWQPGERVAWILERPPLFAPGRGWSYADTNFIVAALAVEAATGEDAYASIRAELLEPLGLADTLPSDRRALPGLVQGHPWLAREAIGAPERTLGEDGLFFCNPQMEWAGGGFCSTARDLARWGDALLAGDVLRPATRAWMAEGVAADTAPGDRYGLGLQLWEAGGELGAVQGHGGWFPGYLSELAHFPRHGITLALQVNTDELPKTGRLREHLVAFARDVVALLPAPPPGVEDYELRQVRGWPVRVRKVLLEREAELAARGLAELEQQLHQVERALPAAAVARLREVEIWVEDGSLAGAMCFHPSAAWLRANRYSPAKAGSVELTNPRNFLAWIGHQPWMVLHELAHAWHFRVLDAEQPARSAAVQAAFTAARESGRYDQVLVWDGNRGRHYALNDAREYFAELTEAWFGTNDFYPFVRAELQQHDPTGATAIAAAWQN